MKAEFVKMLQETGDPRLLPLADTLENTSPEVSVRFNPSKEGRNTGMAARTGGAVAWWEGGAYLPSRPKFTLDPALHQGRYYVQDASSMVMAAVARELAAGEPVIWLDACAAPGGKTTAALDGLPQGSLVVANEYDYLRADILRENVAKWGNPNVVVTRGDTARFRPLKSVFDVIAVDAPCSGEGMMRKDLTAREQWSEALVEECVVRQMEIVDNLWGALRPGGYMVYSTCTFNVKENELMIERIRREYEAESVELRLGSDSGEMPEGIDREISVGGIAPTHALRFIPGRARGEGLFLAVLRKPGDAGNRCPDSVNPKGKKNKPKGKEATANAAALSQIRHWITPDAGEEYDILPTAEGARIFPQRWGAVLPLMFRHLDVVSAGVEAATVKGKDVIPSQDLALSTLLSRGAFPEVELTVEAAIDYLSRETVGLPEGTPRGFVLLTYGGYPLGFVKNIGNRANNLYPKEWRIRTKG